MSKEIKQQIDKLNLELESVFTPDTFVLNPNIVSITNKIADLQKECAHHFIEGKCEFCYLEENQCQ